ncbi:hypothetical protein HCN44_010849 [Aphidius gifuensis]|uniref:Uncharacterized protein n=1 Tax=Aphidius gifuensis TaxID=684658 RepID=A0A835CWL8_APHGI|nr:hypothetical protein HCN44_010849 [Aphidius gifuensis]
MNIDKKPVDTPISDQAKVADIKLSIFAAKHMSILAVGHLSELIASETKGTGSYLENLRLHRTKCAAIIKYVVSPSLLSSLVTAIGDNKYSLIVDESTDVSCTKWMCLCVRYFNTKKGEIMTDFLGLFLVGEATAECLYDSTIEFLTKINLKIQNMLAIGTDGANNLCGQYKSLYALLKKQNPKLILMKCTCHSLALCCSKSSKMIPEDSEFLVRELYNYFSHSPLRTLKYRETFDLLNIGVDANSFRKLIQIANTRWLSYGSAVKRVLEQWTELKCHFKIIAQNEGDMARMILSRMEDDQVRLYLLFLNPILHDMNRLNIKLQQETSGRKKFSDVYCVLKDFLKADVSLSSYENQWNKLPFVNWKDHFSTEIPRNIVLFWPKVYSFQDASGQTVPVLQLLSDEHDEVLIPHWLKECFTNSKMPPPKVAVSD